MIPSAWRPVLAAALACLLPPALHATTAPEAAPVSRASFTTSDPPPAPATPEAFAPAATPDPSDSPDPSAQLSTPAASPAASFARPPSPDLDALGRSLGYLTLFAAIAGAAIYFFKFGLPLARKSATAERKLQVLETRPLGNRQYLLVVAYDDSRMLLGITPGKIDYLCPLDTTSNPKDFGTMMATMEKTSPSA
jgi:flagellar biogenesis protein FliO